MPRAFRLVCNLEEIPLVEEFLKVQGFRFQAEAFSPWARRLTKEPFPLGRSQAAFWGLIYIQDRSSMLPPLALNPKLGDHVLDMCASPGSKTGFLAQLVGKTGFVLANEPNRARLATLRKNLLIMNLLQVATCSCSGEKIPLPNAFWDQILLDPPCSGWGTTERHPNVIKLWRPDKITPLLTLQRRLLTEAARLLKPNGTLIYSTCTTNIDENEAQIRFAIEELGLSLEPLEPFPDFVFAPSPLDCLRVDGEASRSQGFFIAKLRKPNQQHKTLPQILTPSFLPIPPAMLLDFGIDPSQLPSGQIGKFGDTLHFLPAGALLPADLRWQGMTIGKSNGIPSPRLRCLIRKPVSPVCRLDLEIDDLEALIQGRSLIRAEKGKQGLLFWHDLPLGRVRLKDGRALWSEH